MAAAVGEQVSDYSVFDYKVSSAGAFGGSAILAFDKASERMRGVFANWDKEFMLHVVDIDLKQWLKDHKVSIFEESSAIDPAVGERLVSEALNLKLSGKTLLRSDFAAKKDYLQALSDDPGALRFQTCVTEEDQKKADVRGLRLVKTIVYRLAEESPQNACSCLTEVSERVIAQREGKVYHGMRPAYDDDGGLLKEAFLAAKAANFGCTANFGCKDGEKRHPSHP